MQAFLFPNTCSSKKVYTNFKYGSKKVYTNFKYGFSHNK